MSDNDESFESLQIWKFARELRRRISSFIDILPENEKDRLSDQLVRTSRTVTQFIADGHGRQVVDDNIRCCQLARGSLNELLDQLTVALDEKYISEDEYTTIKTETQYIIDVLNGYITYLKAENRMTEKEEE